MKEFLKLCSDLIQTTDPIAWESILLPYLEKKDKDTIQIAFQILLSEKKIKFPVTKIRNWISKSLELPDWLIEECKTRVGNDSVNLSLLFPEPKTTKGLKPKEWMETYIDPLFFTKNETIQKESLLSTCWTLSEKERILFLKMILPGKTISFPTKTLDFIRQWKTNRNPTLQPTQEPFLCKLALGYAKKSTTAIGCYTDLGLLGKSDKNEWIKITTIPSPDLTETEEDLLNDFINGNRIQKFGPVLSVSVKLVFEISFLGVETSKRHKAGFILVSPRIKKIMEEEDLKSVTGSDYFKSFLKTENETTNKLFPESKQSK
ncbi:hypothetical protein LPTSP3_g24950 [Leptospira kobayashii]|uniref:DNA ligase (ATP) n=1 Tax=Leptospira kobayashii TaxID=1917830 RepID=A0ABN6KES2_9LEPT|nr:hypothetical protein [Leptospira kobayashii]BDA79565.1 hypothetical protein LPTSP3_g24950 [Leptospira kobayashii]